MLSDCMAILVEDLQIKTLFSVSYANYLNNNKHAHYFWSHVFQCAMYFK